MAIDPDMHGPGFVSQDHYLRAGQSHAAPQGYAAVTFNATEPITIVMRAFTTVMLEAPEGKELPFGIDLKATSLIPGIERRAFGRMGGETIHLRGWNRLFAMPRGYTRVELNTGTASPDDPRPEPFIFDIPADAPDTSTVIWDR